MERIEELGDPHSDVCYDCPVEASIDVLGGKWKIILLWYLMERSYRFGELRDIVGGISEKMLTRQLRQLEDAGLVSRKSHPEIPPRVEYSITSYGRTVKPVMDALCSWGERHIEQSGSAARWTARPER